MSKEAKKNVTPSAFDCTLAAILERNYSKNAAKNIKALLLCEESFSVRRDERGLEKGTDEYNAFKIEYNAASRIKVELIAKGMDCSKGTHRISYGNPDKSRTALRGGVNPDSALYRAEEEIRMTRMDAFRDSRKNGKLPSEVGLSDKVWIEIALAIHVVPAKYREQTDNGNLVHNKDTAAAWLADFKCDISKAKKTTDDARKEAEEGLKAA